MSGVAAVWSVQIRRALAHFELNVQLESDAPRIVLLGPSGAGKTQLLRAIAGLTTPSSGQIQVAGELLFDSRRAITLPPQERELGVMFQDYALFPHLTVQQNLAFASSKGLRNPCGAADAAIEAELAHFGLAAHAQAYPHALSGGQRQRVALARALLSKPRALLLDEPFAALDRPLRLRLRAELAERLQQSRLPALVITHDEADAAALDAQVFSMQDGRLSQGQNDQAQDAR